jgi:hypothetical protein
MIFALKTDTHENTNHSIIPTSRDAHFIDPASHP